MDILKTSKRNKTQYKEEYKEEIEAIKEKLRKLKRPKSKNYFKYLIKSKISYFFGLLFFLLLIKVLSLKEVFKITSEFLIKMTELIGK